MPIKAFFERYSIETCRAHPDAVFIFGDNMVRAGRGGQAIVRDEPNVIGIPTKHSPSSDHTAYFTDADHDAFKEALIKAIRKMKSVHQDGRIIFWPADGIGTGLAEMDRRAPQLYADLVHVSRTFFERHGVEAYDTTLVCGGRYFDDRRFVFDTLDERFGVDTSNQNRVRELMEGGARGADRAGAEWAAMTGCVHTCVPADWDKYRKAAGFKRNSDMGRRLVARRDQIGASCEVIGFPGGTGTAMMLNIARKHGLPVHEAIPDPKSEILP